MKWMNINDAPDCQEVLLAWGTKTSGAIGFVLARKIGPDWVDQKGERVATDGYCAIAWQELPALPNPTADRCPTERETANG